MGMERMEHCLRFESCDWFNDPSVKILVLDNLEAVNVLEAPIYESQLDNMGFYMGLTSDSTSQPYHQNIVGVEGWLVNLMSKEYTRIDRFEINWLNREKGYPKVKFDELATFMKELPGQAYGKSFGL